LMALERTFSIIKPDATARNLTGAINAMIEKAGLRIVAQKRVLITRAQAETFYAVHRERPFFRELVDFMISGPVVVQVLEGENAIAAYRDLMGATDPAKAAPGTIRKAHAKSIGEIPCMAPTRPRLPEQKSPSSSRATKSSVDGTLCFHPLARLYAHAPHRVLAKRHGSETDVAPSDGTRGSDRPIFPSGSRKSFPLHRSLAVSARSLLDWRTAGRFSASCPSCAIATAVLALGPAADDRKGVAP